MERYTVKAPLIAELVKRGGSWPALWDAALHLAHGTLLAFNLSPGFLHTMGVVPIHAPFAMTSFLTPT